MGRYTEKAAYIGFALMCIFQRVQMTAMAALFHDMTSVILALGIFVEGVRLI